ncbi:MAG: TraB/VirB10 family protein [Oligoflexales bacterium]
MSRSLKSLFRRTVGKSRIEPKYYFYFICFLLLILIYFFSKSQNHSLTTISSQSEGPSTSRILSSNSEIYKRKEKIYSSKIKELEAELSQMHQQINAYKDEQALRNKNTSKKEKQEEENTKHDPAPLNQTPIAGPQISSAVREFETTLANGPIPEERNIFYSQANRHPNSSMRNKISSKGRSIISFPVQTSEKPLGDSVTIPSGSFVKAKLLTGIEAPEGKALPVLLQADYAFIGPNKSQIDLSGCFLIAKSTGNLSIERVEMQVAKISCVSRSGKSFERKVSGFVADGKDNSFAIAGEVSSKQDQVATMAFLSSVVEGISSAVSQAQTSTLRDAQSTSTMISGSQQKYIAAGGASNAANTITNWYLQHAEKLLPTINIGSGQEVWIIVQEKTQLPNWYFKRTESKKGNTSYLSNILH